MRKLINEYKVDGVVTILRIESTKYNPVDVVFDTKFIETVKLFSWCFEQSKGQVFCFDFKLGWNKKLGCTTNKFFLYKLIAFLHSGDNKAVWHRKNLFDYRVSNGIIVLSSGIKLTTVNHSV